MNARILAALSRAVDLLIVLLIGVFLFGLFELNLFARTGGDLPIEFGWETTVAVCAVVFFCIGLVWVRNRAIPVAAAVLVVLNTLAYLGYFGFRATTCDDCFVDYDTGRNMLPVATALYGLTATAALASIAAGVAFAVGVRKFIIRPPATPAGSHDNAKSEPAAASSASDLHARLAPQQN
jgi:hypothetical protein